MSLRVVVEIFEKIVFWVERGTEEAKWSFSKTITIWLLKTKSPLTSWVSYSRVTRKMPQMHRASFAGSYFSRRVARELQNSLCKILEEIKISFLIFTAKLRDSLLATYSQNASEGVFQQNRVSYLEKHSIHKWYTKTLSKSNKILINLFGFDHQAIKYTQITFEHV